MGGGKHLSNSIRYIMNPKKTEDGKWIGGNAGVTSDEVYQMMMDTKMDWDKLEGRQGYHLPYMELRSSRGRKDTSLICHNMKKKEDIMMWFMQQENLCKKK